MIYPIKNLAAFTGLMAAYCGIASAMPSGLTNLPAALVHPKIKGSPLPVEMLPHTSDPKMIYVKPTEGIFVNQGLVKSPLSQCNLVQGELAIADQNAKARNMVVASLRQAQADHQKNQTKYRTLIQKFEELEGLLVPARARLADIELEHTTAKSEWRTAQDEVEPLERKLDKATDPQQKKELAELVKKAREIAAAKESQMDEAYAALKKMRRTVNDLETEHGSIKGRKQGFEKTLTVQLDELTRIQDQLDKMLAQSEKILKKYSERVGGYTTFTVDFAPASYLAALKTANPGYSFQYVPSMTASVDALIPGQIRGGSPLESRTGRLILDAKWNDAKNGRADKKFKSNLPLTEDSKKDPIQAVQAAMSEPEGSLTGAKALSLELSVLGYCALKEPESLATEMNAGAKDTFKLALYYTYPVQYELKLSGKYNSYQSLYDFHKITSSSSWFGLSQSQKQEHVQRLVNSTAFDIKVEPLGVIMTAQESLALAEKVKEQLLFFSVQPYLDQTPIKPEKAQLSTEQLGATKVGQRLMMIPNPWTFWGGLVLSALGEMFGSKSAEAITQISKQTWINLNYQAGFAFLHSADLTIGDLTKAQLIEK